MEDLIESTSTNVQLSQFELKIKSSRFRSTYGKVDPGRRSEQVNLGQKDRVGLT